MCCGWQLRSLLKSQVCALTIEADGVESAVTVLTDANFEELVNGGKDTPWCFCFILPKTEALLTPVYMCAIDCNFRGLGFPPLETGPKAATNKFQAMDQLPEIRKSTKPIERNDLCEKHISSYNANHSTLRGKLCMSKNEEMRV